MFSRDLNSWKAIGRFVSRWLGRPAAQVMKEKWPRRMVGLGAFGAWAGYRGMRGVVSGYDMMVQSPEDMANRARNYGLYGDEQFFRRQGRMPSNHLGHSGIGLASWRLRHGRPSL